MPLRDTPPDPLQDSIPLDADKQYVAPFRSSDLLPDDEQDTANTLTPTLAQQLGRQIYDASTDWINSGRRVRWTDSLRTFQNLHPSGSKYLSTDYRYRSRLFRPKSRTVVRKKEAHTAAAFFSNEDVVNISPQDDDDQQQLASAAIMQELLQYRLTKTIPWFLTLIAARQDAEVMGICVAKAHWKYSEKRVRTERRQASLNGVPHFDEAGMPVMEAVDIMEKIEDHPAVDLIPPENFRFDPGADFRDVVGTSPYLIELIPMYAIDIRNKIKDGEWKSVGNSAILGSTDLDDDVTRRAREQGRIPGKDSDAGKPRDYEICFVRSNIIRRGNQDWHFYSIGSTGALLTDPVPLGEVYLHGVRPYVVGQVIIEAHKTYPSSTLEITRDLQLAANDTWNLRFDNVKLALQPRQIIRTGSGIELQDARTFMPGKTMMSQKPEEDIRWDRPPEVTESAYAEQDRINLDFDDLVGDFSNSSVQANQSLEQSATGMHLMSGQAGGLNEYELRVFAETLVEPLLRLLVKLEQAYETDPVVLAIAGKKAQLLQKFGMNEITDEMLSQDLTVRVNVGIGATNPTLRLVNLQRAASVIAGIFGPSAAMGANFEEIVKEVFGLSGYKDGARFFQPNFDPRVAMLQQQLQHLQQKIGGKGQPDPNAQAVEQSKLQLEAHVQQSKHNFETEKLRNQHLFDMGKLIIDQGHLDLDRARFHVERAGQLGLESDQAQNALAGLHQRISDVQRSVGELGVHLGRAGQQAHAGLSAAGQQMASALQSLQQ